MPIFAYHLRSHERKGAKLPSSRLKGGDPLICFSLVPKRLSRILHARKFVSKNKDQQLIKITGLYLPPKG